MYIHVWPSLHVAEVITRKSSQTHDLEVTSGDVLEDETIRTQTHGLNITSGDINREFTQCFAFSS